MIINDLGYNLGTGQEVVQIDGRLWKAMNVLDRNLGIDSPFRDWEAFQSLILAMAELGSAELILLLSRFEQLLDFLPEERRQNAKVMLQDISLAKASSVINKSPKISISEDLQTEEIARIANQAFNWFGLKGTDNE